MTAITVVSCSNRHASPGNWSVELATSWAASHDANHCATESTSCIASRHLLACHLLVGAVGGSYATLTCLSYYNLSSPSSRLRSSAVADKPPDACISYYVLHFGDDLYFHFTRGQQ